MILWAGTSFSVKCHTEGTKILSPHWDAYTYEKILNITTDQHNEQWPTYTCITKPLPN